MPDWEQREVRELLIQPHLGGVRIFGPEARHAGWAWPAAVNNALSSVTFQQRSSPTRERSGGAGTADLLAQT